MQTDSLYPKKLRNRISQVMLRIRNLTPKVPVSPTQAKGSEVWEGYLDGESVKRVIIYLRSSGCWWAVSTGKTPRLKPGCLFCEHSVAQTTFGKPISTKDYVEQFIKEFQKYDYKEHPILCVYNEGNFFNENELPAEARREILRIISHNRDIKSVILESLPRFITEEVLAETVEILRNKRVEIGVGLESANPLIRSLCINKSFDLQTFERVAELVNKYADLLVYVLIKPPFLTEAEALIDAINTAWYAFSHGARVVSLEPLSVGEYTMQGFLYKVGLYRPPWLWTVLEVARIASLFGEVRIGGYQFAPAYELVAHNCEICTPKVKNAIRTYNATLDDSVLMDLDCHCKEQWKEDLRKAMPSLTERIPQMLDAISSLVGE